MLRYYAFNFYFFNLPFATSDCLRLRFCQLTDIVRVTNFFVLYCIVIVLLQFLSTSNACLTSSVVLSDLHTSPHHSHHLRSHHLSLHRHFTPDLKLISFTNTFLRSLSGSFLDCLLLSRTHTVLSWHLPVFVLVSSFIFFCFWLRVLD